MLLRHAMGRLVVRMLYRPILALQAIHKAWSHPPVIQLLEFGTCAHQASTNCYILLRDAHPVKATGGDVSKDHWEAQAEGSMYRLSGVFKCVLIYVCIVLPFSQASPQKISIFLLESALCYAQKAEAIGSYRFTHRITQLPHIPSLSQFHTAYLVKFHVVSTQRSWFSGSATWLVLRIPRYTVSMHMIYKYIII
jgi:hypothetical protein